MKIQQTKILSVITLVIAITAMSVGFAAFSTTLNISSSATVTPKDTNIQLTMYGIGNESVNVTEWENAYLNYFDNSTIQANEDLLLSYYSSTTTTVPLATNYIGLQLPTGIQPLTLNNDNHTISNINVSFTELYRGLTYSILLKNESDYDVYIDPTSSTPSYPKQCVPLGETTPALVEAACKNTGMQVEINSSDPSFFSELKLSKGEFIIVLIDMVYGNEGTLADGPYTAAFDDLQLNYSTASYIK